MPASVTLSHLSYTGPDGRALFSNLDLTFGIGRTALVGRNGVGKTTLLRIIAGELAATSGTAGVAGTLGVLRQSVEPRPGETVADLFSARPGLAILARAENGEATPEELAEADWTLETRLAAALAAVGLDAGAGTPLAQLSGGQRTRAALAALVFADPDLILLDEPTNNLDAEGRAAVGRLLGDWKGAAIVVSHDRTLLDTMDATVELTGLGATTYGGNYTFYRERKSAELAGARRDLDVAERQVRDAAAKAQDARERQDRRNTAGRRKAARGDIPRILLGGMKGNAETTTGGLDTLAARTAASASAQAQAAREKIEVLAPFAVDLGRTGLPAGRVVLRARALAGGYDPTAPVVETFELEIVGPERIALIGGNGSGKTTLLKLLTGDLPPSAGTVEGLVPMAVLDQQVSLLDRQQSVADNFRRLNPETTVNAARSALAAFRFRADAALQLASTLSGGELLRAGLACVLGGPTPPSLLVLDEPTNHLDIDSIEVVEAGLRAYDGALLVVSHDRAFLDAIGITRQVGPEAWRPPSRAQAIRSSVSGSK